MKDLKQFILEGKNRQFPSTVGKFFQWYSGENLSKITGDNLEDWGLDFLEDDLEMKLNEIADFINKHWNDKITVSQTDIGNCYDTSFEIDNKQFDVDAVDWLGAPFRTTPF